MIFGFKASFSNSLLPVFACSKCLSGQVLVSLLKLLDIWAVSLEPGQGCRARATMLARHTDNQGRPLGNPAISCPFTALRQRSKQFASKVGSRKPILSIAMVNIRSVVIVIGFIFSTFIHSIQLKAPQ